MFQYDIPAKVSFMTNVHVTCLGKTKRLVDSRIIEFRAWWIYIRGHSKFMTKIVLNRSSGIAHVTCLGKTKRLVESCIIEFRAWWIYIRGHSKFMTKIVFSWSLCLLVCHMYYERIASSFYCSPETQFLACSSLLNVHNAPHCYE